MVDGRFRAQLGRMGKITQKVLGLRATKNVTEIDEPRKAGKMDTRTPARDARGWKIEGRKEGLPERNLKNCGRNLQLKVSWPGEEEAVG